MTDIYIKFNLLYFQKTMKNFAGRDFDRMFGDDTNYRAKNKMKSNNKKNWMDVDYKKSNKKNKRVRYKEIEW